jgi:hypothetical protein
MILNDDLCVCNAAVVFLFRDVFVGVLFLHFKTSSCCSAIAMLSVLISDYRPQNRLLAVNQYSQIKPLCSFFANKMLFNSMLTLFHCILFIML